MIDRTYADLISYLTNFFGIIRATCVTFQMSPRNSPTAVAHLLHTTKTRHIFLGHEDSIHELSSAALEIVETEFPDDEPPTVSSIPLFNDLYVDEVNDQLEGVFNAQHRPQSALAFLLHSSGQSQVQACSPTT